ncbi:MAG: hypothetical protein F4Z28_03895 [Gammaproteobacteria bacterium]|nr:hypothetical protein [Gammaproteobacteria bacterium]
MTLAEIKAKLDEFSPAKIRFIANVVDSLANPPKADIRQQETWITRSSDWIEYFGLALSVHHGATTEPLGLTAFETVFRNACDSIGWQLAPVGSATQRFVDLEVTDESGVTRRLSLKSTAARKLSESTAHISKLTEAAWIQDTRTPKDRRQRLRALFADYREAVGSIIFLRAFRRDGETHRYQLIEIPTTLFDSVQDAPIGLFQSDAPLIPCQKDGQTVATIAVDRSDAKITVRRIELASCTVHAEWTRA